MLEKSTLARPYAQAAFRHAQQAGKLQRWSEMLGLLAGVVRDPTMARLTKDPRLGRDRLGKLLEQVCGKRLDAGAKNFVRALAEHNRVQVLPEVLEQFEVLKREAEARIEVEVTSAYPVTAEQAHALADALQKHLGREVALTSHVDPTLLGGVVVRAGDTVIDGSLLGRLRQLGSELGI
jgi:F-type H+-transporting ATPase subunit delta